MHTVRIIKLIVKVDNEKSVIKIGIFIIYHFKIKYMKKTQKRDKMIRKIRYMLKKEFNNFALNMNSNFMNPKRTILPKKPKKAKSL